MSDLQRKALRDYTYPMVGAALAYVASLLHPPTVEVAAVFGIVAVTLFSVQYVFDGHWWAAGAWLGPTMAGALVVFAATPIELRLFALYLAALGVIYLAVYPRTAAPNEIKRRIRRLLQ